MLEIWKRIEGTDYMASNLGNIKSLKRGKSRVLKQGLNRGGYNQVKLYVGEKKSTIDTHKLVAMAFLGHKPNGHTLVVDHRNVDKLDNRLCNLQIITNRENLSKDKRNKTSKYTGVSFHKDTGKWNARIYYSGKNHSLGLYHTEIEASDVYQSVKRILG